VYVLYGGPFTRGLLVEMVLAEGGIAYLRRTVDIFEGEHRSPAYLAVNPAGWLPALITPEGETLVEAPAINLYLTERHGLAQLAPPAEGLAAPTTTSFVEDFQRGRRQFHDLGCAGCHRPMLVLESPILVLDGLPPIDLSREMREPALRWDAGLGGYPVWLFSDLKRHDMGDANTARHVQLGVVRNEYLTPRLWAVADSAPYLHDGRAPSFDYAVAAHDGEGAAARAAFVALPLEERGPLRVYLMSLRRASRLVVP